MIQYILIGIIALIVLGYIGRSIYRMFTAPVGRPGCEGCSGCELKGRGGLGC